MNLLYPAHLARVEGESVQLFTPHAVLCFPREPCNDGTPAAAATVSVMRITILGLGIIGSTWARNHYADGRDIRTWNRTRKADVPGFTVNVTAAVAGADVIMICVADPPAVQQVIDAIASGLRAGQIVVQTSTISAAWTIRFAEQVAARGAAFLDCPFTGSKPAAEQRQTVFYSGGDAAILERARPALAPLSKAILHVGDIGAASSLKLAMNVNIALVGQALCESLALARRAGLNDETFFKALQLNASRSGVADLKEPKLRARDWSPQFSIKHMAKDLRLAMETAGDLPLAQAREVLRAYESGLAQGWGDQDFASLMRLVDPS